MVIASIIYKNHNSVPSIPPSISPGMTSLWSGINHVEVTDKMNELNVNEQIFQ